MKREEAKEKVLEQLEEERKKGVIVFFSDGSAMVEGVGAAATLDGNKRKVHLIPRDSLTNYEAEIIGIDLAVEIARLEQTAGGIKEVAVFGDNVGSLKRAHLPLLAKSGQHLLMKLKSAIYGLDPGTSIRWYWAPGHENIPLNKKADSLAKEASKDPTSSICLPRSLGATLQRLRKTLKDMAPLKTMVRPQLRTPPKEIFEALARLEKPDAAVIMQLQAGHSPLNAHLFKRGLVDSPDCPTCRATETMTHFLVKCKIFAKERSILRKKINEEKIKVNWNVAEKLLDQPLAFPLLSS